MRERHQTLNAPRKTVDRARSLRKDMSLPEVLLWRELRKRSGGFKFRRQHPVGPYVADFVCMSARLVIEIDGEAHDRGDRPERDEARDVWMAEQGYRTIRIAARDVLSDLTSVIDGIVAQCRERGDPSTVFDGMHGSDRSPDDPETRGARFTRASPLAGEDL